MIIRIYTFLEKYNTSTTFFYSLFRIIFVPIFLLFEFLLIRFYWNKIIFPEFITNDNLFNFIDKNDFGIKFGKFFKKDLIEGELESNDNEIIKHRINSEFVKELGNLITLSSKIDIENYINIRTEVSDKISKIQGEIFINKIYQTEIRFCRYYFFKEALKQTIIWIISMILILISVYFFMKFWI